VEELYLLQKLFRNLGSGNVDHRLMQSDFSDQDGAPVFPSLGVSIQDLEQQETVLIVGSNIRQDQPIAGHRVRKAALYGAFVSCINPLDYDFNFPVSVKQIVSPRKMIESLAAVLKVLAESAELPDDLTDLIKHVNVDDSHRQIADHLKRSDKSCILMGHDAHVHAAASTIRALVQQIALLSGANFGYLTHGANTAGAWLTGAVPHRGPGGGKTSVQGKDLNRMLAEGLSAYLLLGVEPEHDFAHPQVAATALTAK
jgi:NADH-quinone oxidoreductase subunit G